MRLEWLEDILAVVETGSFSQAAARRLLTQSAFSRRIQNIEEHVGVQLFDRTRKPVQLRPNVQDQLDQIARLAAMLRQLVHDLRLEDRRSGNRIVIASQHALTATLAPTVLRSLQAAETEVHARLRSANRDDCFALLLSRQADIGLVYRVPGEAHPVEADYIEVLELGMERLLPVAAATREDELRETIATGDLPYIAYPSEVFFGEVLERGVFRRLGGAFRPVSKAETALTLAALELAAQGFGVSWVPASLAAARLQDGSLIDLSDALPASDLQVTAVRLSGSKNATEALVWNLLSGSLAGPVRLFASAADKARVHDRQT